MTVGDPAAPHASEQFRKFVTEVEKAGDLPSPEEAEQLVRATVRAVGEVVTRGQADRLSPGLPDEVASDLAAGGTGQAKSVDKRTFLDQVSGAIRSGDLDEVEKRVGVVCRTLVAWSPPGEIDGLTAQMPADLAALVRG
jgi:uncharacterized protein (DUF2267 family)